MPRIPHPPANQYPLQNAAALVGVMIAAAGMPDKAPAAQDTLRSASPAAVTALGHQGLASVSEAPSGTSTVPEAGPTIPSTNTNTLEMSRRAGHGSENAALPEKVEASIKRDTVHLSVLGCSGAAIRGPKGKVIGVLTAEHCSLTDAKNERIQGSDGKYYIVQPQPVKARVGASQHGLSTVATIDRFVVPNTSDSTRDLAIGVAKGQNSDKVLRTYEHSTLPIDKLLQLKEGTKVFMAGWPEYQPDNHTGAEERQSFSMSFLGLGHATTSEGKFLDLVWASVDSTKDGAECSYGASGSKGFVMVDGQVRSIGTLSYFTDLSGRFSNGTNPPANSSFSFSEGAAAICGFSYETPDLSSGGMVLHAVRSAGEIPGYVSPEQAIATAREQFKNPAYPKTLINGSVEVPPPSNTGKGGPTWVNNPAVFHDAVHNNTVLAWADPTDPDHLAFGYVEDKNLYEVVIYPHGGDAAPDFLSSTGADQYQPDPSTTSGDFIDGSRQVFGGVLPITPNVNGSGFTLQPLNGQLGIIGSKGMK